ncbi:Homeobox protein knotted-1-like [Sarracenia purpurea var. burkii]
MSPGCKPVIFSPLSEGREIQTPSAVPPWVSETNESAQIYSNSDVGAVVKSLPHGILLAFFRFRHGAYNYGLSKPFDEATTFLNKIGTQLKNLCKASKSWAYAANLG